MTVLLRSLAVFAAAGALLLTPAARAEEPKTNEAQTDAAKSDDEQKPPAETKPEMEKPTEPAASAPDGLHPNVKMETSKGDIVLQLDAEKAPISTYNFIKYAEDGFYNNTVFHRVLPTFVIQGGGYTVEMAEKTESDGLRGGIKNEWQNGLKNLRGTIAMARRGGDPDSATSQFFISVLDNPNLDKAQRDGAGYAVFGKVVEGMDTVDKIRDVETGSNPNYAGGMQRVVPVDPVVIKSVKLVSTFDRDTAKAAFDSYMTERTEKEARAKEEAEQAETESKKAMEDYVKNLETELDKKAEVSDSGLVSFVLTEGEGESPKPTDQVEVHYTGWLLDGTKFDSSVDRGTPAKFFLNRVIPGWTEGVGMMKVGEKRKLVIPYKLAYGENGRPPTIPPRATLVFDVELLGIE